MLSLPHGIGCKSQHPCPHGYGCRKMQFLVYGAHSICAEKDCCFQDMRNEPCMDSVKTFLQRSPKICAQWCEIEVSENRLLLLFAFAFAGWSSARLYFGSAWMVLDRSDCGTRKCCISTDGQNYCWFRLRHMANEMGNSVNAEKCGKLMP